MDSTASHGSNMRSPEKHDSSVPQKPLKTDRQGIDTCRFLDLSAEIRNMIYKEVFASQVFESRRDRFHDPGFIPNPEYTLSLLHVNRQANAETSLLAYASMTFCFSSDFELDMFFITITPLEAKAVQNLQLKTLWTRGYYRKIIFGMLTILQSFKDPSQVLCLSRAPGAKRVTLVVYGEDLEQTGEDMNDPTVMKVTGWIRETLPKVKVVARHRTVNEHDGDWLWARSDEEDLDDGGDKNSDSEHDNRAKQDGNASQENEYKQDNDSGEVYDNNWNCYSEQSNESDQESDSEQDVRVDSYGNVEQTFGENLDQEGDNDGDIDSDAIESDEYDLRHEDESYDSDVDDETDRRVHFFPARDYDQESDLESLEDWT